MADLTWTSPAFLVLEALPQKLAFDIFRYADHLRTSPRMGAHIYDIATLSPYRKLIHKRRFRIIYDFVESEDCIYVLHLQSCRQKLPTARVLRKARFDSEGELPLK